MSIFSIVFAVLGLFLAVYAALSLLRRPQPDHPQRGRSLGCGFALLAGMVWSVALGIFMNDWSDGARLGFAAAFVLPALTLFARPEKQNVVSAVVLLGLAVILAAPVLPDLTATFNSSERRRAVQEFETLLQDIDTGIDKAYAYKKRLAEQEKELNGQISDLGYQSFDALKEDDNGMLLLTELLEIQNLQERTEEVIKKRQEKKIVVRSSLRRLRLHAEAESVVETLENIPDPDEIRAQIEPESTIKGPATVEEYARQERLKKLFEEEFQH